MLSKLTGEFLFVRLPELSKLDKRRQEKHKQCWTGNLWQFTRTRLVSFPRSCRNKNGCHVHSYTPLWDPFHRLVKRSSSDSCRGPSYQAGLLQLEFKLLYLVHQHPSAKLRRVLHLLHQWNASRTHLSSALLWCWLKQVLGPEIKSSDRLQAKLLWNFKW